MSTLLETSPGSKTRLCTGRILSGLVVLFLAFGAVMKFVKSAPVIQAFAQRGWPDRLAVPLGIILLTGYLGVLVWAGLYLREDRLRALVPLRS